MSKKKHEWTRKGVTASMAVVLAFGMVPAVPGVALAGARDSITENVTDENKAPAVSTSDRFVASLKAPDGSNKTINNAFFANGDDVVVEPYSDDSLKITVGDGEVYSFEKNSATDGLTIFAGSNNNASEEQENDNSTGSITIKQGAKVSAVYGGGYANSHTDSAEIVVEAGAEARAVYGGGVTPYKNEGVNAGVQVDNVSICIRGYVYLVYAGGNSAVGPTIDNAISLGDSNELISATNLVKSSNIVIDGQCDMYFGGSFSYGAVENSSCVINGALGTASGYSAVTGANGYVGSATMSVSEGASVKGSLYMSMRGYIGNVSLINKGSIESVSLNPDGVAASSFGDVDVANSGSIENCYLDCGCEKQSVGDGKVSPWPSLIRVSGNVTVSTEHWESNKTTQYSAPEGQTVVLLNGAKLAEEQSISNLAVASCDENYYTSLVEAVGNVSPGGTVTLLADCTGGGIGTYVNPGTDVNGDKQIGVKNFTLDLGGNKYTVDSPAVGSKGYESQGFHLEKGAEVTIKNGIISSSGDSVKMLVQNYCDLTLMDVTLDGTSLPDKAYVLSNNYGNVKLTGNTNIVSKQGDIAFDLYYWPAQGYKDGLSVTLDENMTGTIIGDIEYASDGTETDVADKAKLNIKGGTVLGNIVTEESKTGIVISGGIFAVCPEKGYIAESSIAKKNTTEEGLVSFEIVEASNLGEGVYMSNPSSHLAPGCYAVENDDDTWTVYKQSTGGGSGGGSTAPSEPEGEVTENPDGSTTTTVTEEKENADGSTVTTVTETTEGREDGSVTEKVTETTVSEDGAKTEKVTETNTLEDGTSATTVTVDGELSSVEATVSEAAVEAAGGKAVELPMAPVEAASSDKAVELKVEAPAGAKVAVPVAKAEGASSVAPGAVLVLVDAEGNETVLPKTANDGSSLSAEIPGDCSLKVVDASADFPDVDADDWYAEQGVADFVSARGIMTGVETEAGAEFQGGAATNRGMFVTMLNRLEMEAKASSGEGFADVDPGSWYAGSSAWAVEAGIATGYLDAEGNATFDGDGEVTREQMATFLFRYAQWLKMDTSARAEREIEGVSDFAEEAVSWAVAEGLIKGDDETGAIRPTDGATRAEAAVVIMRMIGLMA